jgi:hypothetical protein
LAELIAAAEKELGRLIEALKTHLKSKRAS